MINNQQIGTLREGYLYKIEYIRVTLILHLWKWYIRHTSQYDKNCGLVFWSLKKWLKVAMPVKLVLFDEI